MADRLPAVSGKRAVRSLLKAGFVVDRIVGSHHLLFRPGNEGRAVTVPVHANRDLSAGTLHSIIQQAGMTLEEFCDLL